MSYKAHRIQAASHFGSFPYMEKVVEDINKSWLKNHSQENQLVLYHYTNGSGLKGIIENRSIWCTYINVLNDPEEYQYGKRLIEKRIDMFIEKETDEKVIAALKEIKDFPIGFEKIHKVFVASFCENENLLSQWRGYSEGGVGYNLGFIFDQGTKYWYSKDHQELEKPINLRKVIYDENEQIKIIDDYISALIEGLKQSFNEKSQYRIEEPKFSYGPISILTSNLLLDMMLSMKSSKFKEENEWRLLRILLNEDVANICKYRLIDNELIPYLDTNFYNINEKTERMFPLEFIKIGPIIEYEKNKVIMGMFVETETKKDKQINLRGIYIDHAGYTLRR